MYKETVQVEVALKNEALKQKATIQQLMHFKSEVDGYVLFEQDAVLHHFFGTTKEICWTV